MGEILETNRLILGASPAHHGAGFMTETRLAFVTLFKGRRGAKIGSARIALVGV